VPTGTHPEYRDVLRSSLEEVEQLIALAENLLLLSRLRMTAGLPRHAIDLETLAMEAVDTGVRLADGRGVIVGLGRSSP
jgi:signal transduction histidine kinase